MKERPNRFGRFIVDLDKKRFESNDDIEDFLIDYAWSLYLEYKPEEE